MKSWKNRLQKIWKIKLIRIWMMIFAAIFVAQILCWSVMAGEIGNILKTQTDEAYGNVLNVLSSSCDNDLNVVYSMLDVMALDEVIKKKCEGPRLCAGDEALQNELVKRQLVRYKRQHSFIDDIFLWFEETDKIISSNTVAEAELFFNIYGNTVMPYEEWKEILHKEWFKKDVVWKSLTGDGVLYVLHSWQDRKNQTITIVVKFQNSYVQNQVDSFYSDKFAAIDVRNQEGELLAESAKVKVAEKMRSISRTSHQTGWSYTAYISEVGMALYEKAFLIISLLFFAVVLVTFGAFLAFWRTGINPFSELTQYIESLDPGMYASGSEYVYIKDKFDEIVQKQKQERRAFINQMDVLKLSYLSQILFGKLEVDDNNRQLLKKMQLEFLYKPCGIMLVSDGQDFEKSDNCMALLEEFGMGMRQDCLLYGCSFLLDNGIVCLFRMEESPEEMRKRIWKLVNAIRKKREREYVFAVSSLKSAGNAIKKVYDEAQYVMQSAKNLSISGLVLFDEIQEKVKENTKDNKDDILIRQLREYLEEHYADPDLNIELLCNAFGKSVSYISSLYKKKQGHNILYDLNLIRVEKAKEILENEDIRIDEIGRRCGFANSNSFIRVFKKYENITPGRYKTLYFG